ncbi:unnamed protein product [Tilletia caries]|nr:unnamed protein product [Tilletia caries]
MRAVDQELGLIEVMGRFFFEGLGSMQRGEAIEALKLFTPAETVAWKRFLDRQGEAIDTGDTSLYDFTCLLPDPGCPTSTSNLLSLPKNNELDENGLRPRRSGRTRSPNARYADKSYSLDHSHSKGQHAAQESEDGDEDEEDHDGTDLTFRIQNTSAHGPQPGKPDSGNDDFDDDFSEEDEVNRSSDLRGKRKAGSATRQQNAPSKKLKASSAEERVFDQARGRPRTIVPLTSTPPPKGRVPPATADADEDVEPLKDDEDKRGDGVGTLETVTIRQAAKDRWAPLKSGAKEWRHEYLNKVHSQTVLYYFDLMSRVKKNGNWQLTWKCRCCGKPRSTPSTGFSNLSSHIRAKPPIPHCHMRKTPCDSAVRP